MLLLLLHGEVRGQLCALRPLQLILRLHELVQQLCLRLHQWRVLLDVHAGPLVRDMCLLLEHVQLHQHSLSRKPVPWVDKPVQQLELPVRLELRVELHCQRIQLLLLLQDV